MIWQDYCEWKVGEDLKESGRSLFESTIHGFA